MSRTPTNPTIPTQLPSKSAWARGPPQPKIPTQLPPKSAWARGPPQQNSTITITPRSQSPAPPTSVSGNPATSHGIPRNAVKQWSRSPITFGSIDGAVAHISSSPAVKPADVVKSFGSVAVQNGGSDAAKSSVTSRPSPVSDTPTSSSHAVVVPPPSTQSPVPKFNKKSWAELIQGPSQSASTPSPEELSDINGLARKTEEDEDRRRKEEKRDREEQEKPAVPPVRFLRNANRLKIYRHLFSFLADKINPMNTLDRRLESLLPRLHTHFEKFVDYDMVVSISESRPFRETLLEASLMIGDERYTTALDNDNEEICALFQEVLLDTTAKYKSTIRSLRDEQAKGFMQELQEALERGSPLLQEDRLQHTAQRMLIELSKACRDVPNELYVKETIEHVSSKPIYKGTFGYIHRGRCNGGLVALKRLIVLENTKDVERLAQLSAFCKEAMVWKNLCGHPHILAFRGIDIESFPGEMCMVSEWMSNGTIIKFLKREPSHPIEKYLLQIAEGIQHLHSQGMCHGDLKGENILVSSNRDAKIADFGLANFANMSATYTTVRMGTPRWMAPELLNINQKFRRTTKSDIFAFACIAFEIYTGAPIFPDDDNARACQRILAGGRPERPTDYERAERPTDGRRIPDRMWDLIKWCWSQDPSSRPQIDKVIRELQEVDGSVSRNDD